MFRSFALVLAVVLVVCISCSTSHVNAFQSSTLAKVTARQHSLSVTSPLDLHQTSHPLRFKSPSVIPSTRTSHTSTKSTTTSLNSVLNPVVLTAALGATSKLLSSIGIGALATPSGPKQFGRILDANAVSALSKLTYWLFQPCFLLCGVASTLAKASQQSSAAGATAAGVPKSALLLLPLAALIQISLGSITAKVLTTKRFGIRPAFLGIDTDDDAGANDIAMCTTFANSGPLPLIITDALFSGGIASDVAACISFYLLVWSPLFWTVGKSILGLNDSSDDNEKVGLVASVGKQIKTFLSPPVIGSILGVIIGSTAVLRNLLLSPSGLLAPLFGSLRTMGVAYLPSAILVLAGSLVKKKDTSASTTDSDKSALSAKSVVAILLARFILSPILALSTVRLMTFAKLMPTDNARALAIVTFTLLMEGCMPPAQNSVILLNLANEKARASKMAKMLTVIYALSAVPVTLLLGGCLGKSGILGFA
jgi:hypothetical protein